MQGKFDVFPDNQNEQTTLKPLEKKIIKDFNCSEFIFCSDAGLGSANNRAFNSIGNRAYVITHSIKKMKQEYCPESNAVQKSWFDRFYRYQDFGRNR